MGGRREATSHDSGGEEASALACALRGGPRTPGRAAAPLRAARTLRCRALVRPALLLPLVLLGCASSKGTLRTGAELVVDTPSGPQEGELFAVSRDAVWLCDGTTSVEVPKADLRAARTRTADASLDVSAPETWAGVARHPEGPPSAGTNCRLTHEDQPPAYVVARLRGDVTVQGPLLAVDESTIVIEVDKGPRCAAVKELTSLKLLLSRDVLRKDTLGSGAGIVAVPFLGVVAAAIIGTVAVVDVARGDPDSDVLCAIRRCTDEQHFLADVDLAHVAALKPVARYPGGLPPVVACAPPADSPH